ncbi:receptor protein kinase TMK1-like [Phoenix dactylifera]|uniref:Receptor protein kinase TMK1-like n=1 Tax=Phoenix dactylifera TaxID=42345 RepID=A0A8B7D3L4_PHODC|nr:receptor protein kinase TMK1-like [Phoenix dactylifera]
MGKVRSPSPLPLLLLLFLSLLPSPSLCDDSAAMQDIAKSLIVPQWKLANGDPCSWPGVSCQGGSVVEINLRNKGVSGELSASISNLSSLKSLQLQKNQIKGDLPSLANLASLQSVYIDSNAFSTMPADFFSGLTSLQTMTLDKNPFKPWSIPDDVSKCENLVVFSASDAGVTGNIPDFFGKMPKLQSLTLSYNTMKGELPASFKGSNIQSLVLNNQQAGSQLTGRIDVIARMTQLSVVWLQSNGFTGPIPDLSDLASLTDFRARDNFLTGVVPPSLISSATLKNVTLSNNKLQGPMPKFADGVTVDIDKGNQFCVENPAEQCDPRVTSLLEVAAGFEYPMDLTESWQGNDPCKNWQGVTCGGQDIVVLNFANRRYSGIISPAIGNFASLQKLILSNNSLSGRIPDSLTKLQKLTLVDVTNNDLSGKVPEFRQTVEVRKEGNPNIGKEVDPSGGDSGSNGSSSKFQAATAAGIVIGVLVGMGCLAAALICYIHRRKRKKFGRVATQTPANGPELVKIGVMGMNLNDGSWNGRYTQNNMGSTTDTQGMCMSIHAIRSATNNFSEDNIIGRGGFGVVYKGQLNGTMIAVKRSRVGLIGEKGNEEFRAEIDVLQRVRHRHLVALLGYCDDEDEQLLVYEYMPGGTLEQHLFECSENGFSPLTWQQRLAVALDVARGVQYLHSLAQESFIHRDLKPLNILLDNDKRAKVSDFGLVKLALDKQKSMMTRLAGTFGYLAPEYAITGKVTTKIDVYAFGVILMELITGERVLDDTRPDEDTNLVYVFRRNILDKENFLKSSPDPNLHLDEEDLISLWEVAELARYCTAREPSQRPDMSHAVNKLAPLVEKWKPTSCDDDSDGDPEMSLRGRLEGWQNGESRFTEWYNEDPSIRYV